MRPALLALLAFAAIRPAQAMADDCDALAAQMVLKHHLTVERRTEADVVLMSHPQARFVSLQCEKSYRSVDIWVSTSTAYPASQFFDLAGALGSEITGASRLAIVKAATSCAGVALRAKDEFGQTKGRGFVVDCQAFSRDGGGTNLTIGKPEK